MTDHSTDEHSGRENLDDFFRDGDSGAGITEVEVHDTEGHEGHEEEVAQDSAPSVASKKSIFRKWWFWAGAVAIFFLVFAALCLLTLGQSGSAGISVPDDSGGLKAVAAAPQQPAAPLAPSSPNPTTAASASSVVPVSATSVDMKPVSAPSVAAPVAPAPPREPTRAAQASVSAIGGSEKASVEAPSRPDDVPNAELLAAKAEIDDLKSKLQMASACTAAETSSPRSVGTKHRPKKVTARGESTAKHLASESAHSVPHRHLSGRQQKGGSTVDQVFEGNYHVVPGAITPGQAVVRSGKAVKYLIVGSEIDGAVVMEIDPDRSIVKTNHGLILP